MAKVSQDAAKYMIEAEIDAAGIVEKSDIIGAIFGQTEGLLGEELDLRELREKGRIGRMEVDIQKEDGSSNAEIRIPTTLNSTDTSLLAASLETIEKVGPSNADLRVKTIRDVRESKRDYIVKRAKQLLEEIQKDSPDKKQITEEIKNEIRKEEVTEYRGFTAGPDVEWSDEIVLVEGKADVVNLLKHGVKNGLAIGGTSVPENISRIAEEKDLTAFLDGDRGGDLILKELKEKAEPRFVAKAPEGKEVEELSKREVHEALRDKSPVKYSEEPETEDDILGETREMVRAELEELVGTRAVNVLDEDMNTVGKAPVNRFESALGEKAHAIVFDGEITNEKIGKAEEAGAEILVGMRKAGNASSSDLTLLTKEEL